MMKCKRCGKDFGYIRIEDHEWRDRGDGVMYGTASYSSHPICPHCGCDNSPKVYMKEGDECNGI